MLTASVTCTQGLPWDNLSTAGWLDESEKAYNSWNLDSMCLRCTLFSSLLGPRRNGTCSTHPTRERERERRQLMMWERERKEKSKCYRETSWQTTTTVNFQVETQLSAHHLLRTVEKDIIVLWVLFTFLVAHWHLDIHNSRFVSSVVHEI